MAKEKSNNVKGDISELLVFGYSCKLFRDDEKALYIDQGKHLIPWMGDNTVKIDRYDGRGALFDLKLYEPLSSFDSMILLTNEEKKIEQLCDEERYYALNTNEDIDLLYQEEELKRLQEATNNKKYGQVGFNYDDDSSIDPSERRKPNEEEDEDDEFVSIHQLDVPINMVQPTSKKHFAIIEKTAGFIHSQGPQMEILLKMKQADNPQFGFLSYDNNLYPFYRHVLSAIQTGRYIPGCSEEKDTKTDLNSSAEQENYLHPSLQAGGSISTVLPELAPSVPSISYKPSEDCAYSMLINKIREKQTVLSSIGAYDTPTSVQSPASTGSRSSSPVRLDNLPRNHSELSEMSKFVSKPVQPFVVSQSAIISGKPEYYNPEDACTDMEDGDDLPRSKELEQLDGSVLIPDPELKIIIDKLVLYVAKNGRDFEIIVKRKCDPRFSFLEIGDKHHPYYEQELFKEMRLNGSLAPTPSIKDNIAVKEQKSDDTQKQCPLRFSIKKPNLKDKVKSALSEDSEYEGEREDVPSPPPPPNITPSSPTINNTEQKSVLDEAEQKRRAARKKKLELFKKMLVESKEKTEPLSRLKETQSSNSNVKVVKSPLPQISKEDKIPVINLSDDESSKLNGLNGQSICTMDLKQRLKALRQRSRSPLSIPPKVKKLKKHKSEHRQKDRRRNNSTSTSRSRSNSRSSTPKSGHRHKKSQSRTRITRSRRSCSRSQATRHKRSRSRSVNRNSQSRGHRSTSRYTRDLNSSDGSPAYSHSHKKHKKHKKSKSRH